MGSYSDDVNVLEYLRSKSSVDCDSLDLNCKFARDQRRTLGMTLSDDSSGERAGAIRRLYFESSRGKHCKSVS